MRLSTKRKEGIISFVNALLFLLFMCGIGLFILNIKFEIFQYDYLFLAFSGLIVLVYLMRGREFFHYDSDGEAINFLNDSPLNFIWGKKYDDFPKYKVKDFSIVDTFIYKKLYIKIESKKKKDIILRYDISYLSSKEIRDLQTSLLKIIKKNKETHLPAE